MFHKKNIFFFAFMLYCIKNYSAQNQSLTEALTFFLENKNATISPWVQDNTPKIIFHEKAIFFAALCNHIPLLIKYTQITGSLKAIGKDGKSVLHYAVLAEHPNNDLIKFYLQKGVNIDKQDDDGNTALHLAVLHNQNQTVTLLLENNAQSIQNNNGLTPLHVAVFQSKYEIIKKLITNKAAFKTTENHGLTPLFLAICNHNLDTVQILLTAEPDITLHQHNNLNVFNFINNYLKNEKNIDKKQKIEAIKAYIETMFKQTGLSKFQSFQIK